MLAPKTVLDACTPDNNALEGITSMLRSVGATQTHAAYFSLLYNKLKIVLNNFLFEQFTTESTRHQLVEALFGGGLFD